MSKQSLKLFIIKEYSSDGTWYYMRWDEDINELMYEYEEVIGNYMEHPEYDEDEDIAEEIDAIREAEEPTANFLKNIYFYDGEAGFETVVYAEEKNIVKEAIEFYNTYLCDEWWREKYDERNPEAKKNEEQIIKNACDNPNNRAAIECLLKMIADLLNFSDDVQYNDMRY